LGDIEVGSFLSGAAGFLENLGLMPKFPRMTRWVGELSFVTWRCSVWLALPLGPLKVVLAWLMTRKTRLDFACMPFPERAIIGMAGAGIPALIMAIFRRIK
jgi:hypothetical protein